jgi:hypothetical protein
VCIILYRWVYEVLLVTSHCCGWLCCAMVLCRLSVCLSVVWSPDSTITLCPATTLTSPGEWLKLINALLLSECMRRRYFVSYGPVAEEKRLSTQGWN